MDAFNSFLKFFTGFLILLSLSFGITYAVNTYSQSRDAQQQSAAAFAAMIQKN